MVRADSEAIERKAPRVSGGIPSAIARKVVVLPLSSGPK